MSGGPPPVGGGAPFDPWTATEAEAELRQAAALAAGMFREVGGWVPDRYHCSPYEQWAAAAEVTSRRGDVEAGSSYELFACLKLCAAHGLRPPDWLGRVLYEGADRINRFEVRTLDEAFGAPFGARHIKALKRRAAIREMVINAICDEVERDPARPIDGLLWEDVAAALNAPPTDDPADTRTGAVSEGWRAIRAASLRERGPVSAAEVYRVYIQERGPRGAFGPEWETWRNSQRTAKS